MKKEGFSKKERLRKEKEFQRVFKEGKKIWIEKVALLFFCSNSVGIRRLGIVVSKKIGKAVKRNRAKRLIREVFRKNKEIFPEKSDIIIIPHPSIVKLKYNEVEEKFLKALKRFGEKSEIVQNPQGVPSKTK